MKHMYLVSNRRLLDLLEAEARLTALETGGVNNWKGYSDSLHDWLIIYFAENAPWRNTNDNNYRDVAFDAIRNFELIEVEEDA